MSEGVSHATEQVGGAEVTRGLQETYAPQSICWGCGPSNPRGLHLQSHVAGDHVVAEWTPDADHAAFPGVLNGGIIGTLLDCHSAWTAAYHFMTVRGVEVPPVTVTAVYEVTLRRPTPTDVPLKLSARVVESRGRKAVVAAELTSEGQVTATCSGTFVAVPEGHPAHGAW